MTEPVTSSVSLAKFGSLPWVRRLRLVVAVGVFWAGLHFLVGGPFLWRGLDRPIALAAAHAPVRAGIALAVVVWMGAYLGSLLTGAHYRERGLLIIALALAGWAYGGGTMTDWLVLSAGGGVVGPPSGNMYWPLVLEYVVLAVMMGVAAGASSLAVLATEQPGPSSMVAGFRRAFGVEMASRERARGWLTLLTCTAIIGILMLVLTGPGAGRTLAGQVYFAVAVASAVGVFAAARLFRVREPIWYWPAPILAGLVGMLVAAMKPGLLIPSEYSQLNSIPAWGLARPLPMQMVGVGVAVCLWALRATLRGDHSERA